MLSMADIACLWTVVERRVQGYDCAGMYILSVNGVDGRYGRASSAGVDSVGVHLLKGYLRLSPRASNK
jgi:hypothetical protein